MTREINGSKDCTPEECYAWQGRLCFTAQDVSQIISLAMDAQKSYTERFAYEIPDRNLESDEKTVNAWRELAERLRSGKC